MAVEQNRETIRKGIGRTAGWLVASGTLSANGAADGSTIVDTVGGKLYSSARDQHIRTRSVVAITSEANRGDRSYAIGSASTAGAVTVNPVFTNQIDSGDAYEVWDSDGPHPDEIDRCIDLALAKLCWYWRITSLTWLRGGDLADEVAVNADDLTENGIVVWTGDGNITLTLQDLEMPDEYIRRVIRIVATATDGGLESSIIECDPLDRRLWWIAALCRSMKTAAGADKGTGNGTEIKIIDKTNSVEITPNEPLFTVNRGWTHLTAGFVLPANCFQIAIQLNVETSGEVGEFGPIQLWPPNGRDVSLPRRIATKNHVGPVFIRRGSTYNRFWRQPWHGSLERRDVGGRGVRLEFDPQIGTRPLWFYEKVGYLGLTTATPVATDDDNTTWAEQAWVEIAALVECYRFLETRDRKEYPGRWDEDLHKAEVRLAAAQVEYGIEPMAVEDAQNPRRRAFVKV